MFQLVDVMQDFKVLWIRDFGLLREVRYLDFYKCW